MRGKSDDRCTGHAPPVGSQSLTEFSESPLHTSVRRERPLARKRALPGARDASELSEPQSPAALVHYHPFTLIVVISSPFSLHQTHLSLTATEHGCTDSTLRPPHSLRSPSRPSALALRTKFSPPILDNFRFFFIARTGLELLVRSPLPYFLSHYVFPSSRGLRPCAPSSPTTFFN